MIGVDGTDDIRQYQQIQKRKTVSELCCLETTETAPTAHQPTKKVSSLRRSSQAESLSGFRRFFMVIANQATFPGFQFPNTTQIPNKVFDSLMPHLSGGELKVLIYICRRTFGFRKDSDRISLSQISKGITTKAGRVLDQGTGLSKRQVQRALRVLEGRRVILVERNVDESGLHEINTYRLNVRGGDNMSPPVETPVSGGVGTPVSTTKQSKQKKKDKRKTLLLLLLPKIWKISGLHNLRQAGWYSAIQQHTSRKNWRWPRG
jgi:phage replication O-like protein O